MEAVEAVEAGRPGVTNQPTEAEDLRRALRRFKKKPCA